MSARRLLALLFPILLVGLAVGSAPASAAPDEAPAAEKVPLETADSDLARLAASIKGKKTVNEVIIGDLEAVAKAFHNLEPPEAPELAAVPEGTAEEEQKAIEAANKKLQDQHETDLGKFKRAEEKYQKDALKLFVKALKLQKIHSHTKSNTRVDVNIKAAETLGKTGSSRAASDVQRALEGFFKAKYEVPLDLLEAAFAALGHLNDMDALEWMADEFTHTKSSPAKVVDQLTAAHKAMVLFKDVPGKLRHMIVQEMVKSYSGVESQAKQNDSDPKIQSAKRFWDRIKNGVIKVVQYYSGSPKNEDGEALASMEEFSVWFREHKNPKRDPWRDEKPN